MAKVTYSNYYNQKPPRDTSPLGSSAHVIVAGRTYRADYAEWIQTAGDYPSIELRAYIAPGNMLPLDDPHAQPTITNVIFNPPATIVFWSDKTKTVVKNDPNFEPYDPEKGIAMAISKKLMGDNKYEYYNVFKHWLKKWDKMSKNETTKTTDEWRGDMYNG